MTLLLPYQFSSAHFYAQKKWSRKRNQTVFGRCFTPYGHGHNYKIEIEVDIGRRDPTLSKKKIEESVLPVIKQLDHEHLNFSIPYFKDAIPTTENISLYMARNMKIPKEYSLKRIRLYEMDSIFVEIQL